MSAPVRRALCLLLPIAAACAPGFAHAQEAKTTANAMSASPASPAGSLIDRVYIEPREVLVLEGAASAEQRHKLAQWLVGYAGGDYEIVAERYFQMTRKSAVWRPMEMYFEEQARRQFGGERERRAGRDDGVGAASFYTVPADPAARVVVATPIERLPTGYLMYALFELRRK